ncbi:MAG: type II toxin-antitoxin system RelE/ParE family toxin [Paludibacteraceae bacterium]|nr:type II toxin-antitoxin system RelE/ParE family toxin [Paludibacteraceae bacterium]
MIEGQNIKWSLLAYDAYQNIGDDIHKRFGNKAKSDFEKEVDETVRRLAKFPNLGKPEFKLAEDGSVRSMPIRKLSKIIYFVDDDVMYIADVWATRQDPNYLIGRFEK